MRTVKRFRGRVVHTAYPEKQHGHPTGRVVVVYQARKGHQRQREIVPGKEYEAEKTVEAFDGSTTVPS